MKLILPKETKVHYQDVEQGQMFVHNDSCYLKTEPTEIYGGIFDCVDLSTGEMSGFSAKELVKLVELKNCELREI